MTAFAMTLPLTRRSPVHVPRRDLVISGGDGLVLILDMVTSDLPDAPAVDLVGIGPQLRLTVWPGAMCWDYGLWSGARGRGIFYSGLGVVDPTIAGRVSFILPRGTFARTGRRLSYSLQLDYAGDVSVIARGSLHLQPGGTLPSSTFDILDDTGQTILVDDGQDLET